MSKSLAGPILGVLAAIGITSTMDATGFSTFSALPLAPLLGLCWSMQRMPRSTVGFRWGERKPHLLAVLYPLMVAAVILAAAGLAGAIDVSQTNWKKTALNFVLVALSTILVACVTEEGFFRGWLWASLERAGLSAGHILIFTSVAFSLWHWSAVILKTGFDPPRDQVPVFMINAAAMGAVWGMMRWRSGSVIVSSVSHGVWNGMAYVLFGFGKRVGALGIKNTGLFGPEVGVLGLVLNLLFAAALWTWPKPQDHKTAGGM